MTLILLLRLFQPFTNAELHAETPAVVEVMRELPADPAIYERIAEDAFEDFLLKPDEPGCERFERVNTILRVLLFQDGRSFEACLLIAEKAHENPQHAEMGVNALAGLANYLAAGLPTRIPRQALVERFEKYMTNETLFHNARECRNHAKRGKQEAAPLPSP